MEHMKMSLKYLVGMDGLQAAVRMFWMFHENTNSILLLFWRFAERASQYNYLTI